VDLQVRRGTRGEREQRVYRWRELRVAERRGRRLLRAARVAARRCVWPCILRRAVGGAAPLALVLARHARGVEHYYGVAGERRLRGRAARGLAARLLLAGPLVLPL
jgi:hypothetical protein